ncbi:hypothetical protein C1646_749317 [Rhizophagus diaphanus]|nr:hypothetical protein C1646_749317 [Rhizophagus diaphanus] [Rhizophagus sp. MUCL 43196]
MKQQLPAIKEWIENIRFLSNGKVAGPSQISIKRDKEIKTELNTGDTLTTWSNNGTVSTRIDFFYISNRLISKVEIHEVLNIEKLLDTDHKALSITVRIVKELWHYFE